MEEGDMERIIFFENARKKAAAEYLVSPHDCENLTRWGGALLELAHFHQGEESLHMVEEALSKLEEAIKIDPKKHETLWCMGNALIANGFLLQDAAKAEELFERSAEAFQKAVDVEPTSELYSNALEMSRKAPAIYAELQKQMVSQELAGLRSSSSANNSSSSGGGAKGHKKSKKKKKSNGDFKYDVMGWVVLAIGICGWISMARFAPPPRAM